VLAPGSDDILFLKGAWLGHVNHLNFGGHQPYLWNGWSVVSVVNWWPSSVTFYHVTHWPSTSVYSMVSDCIMRVCQWQQRFVPIVM